MSNHFAKTIFGHKKQAPSLFNNLFFYL